MGVYNICLSYFIKTTQFDKIIDISDDSVY